MSCNIKHLNSGNISRQKSFDKYYHMKIKCWRLAYIADLPFVNFASHKLVTSWKFNLIAYSVLASSLQGISDHRLLKGEFIWRLDGAFFVRKTYYYYHCVKSVRIRSYSGPYSVRMRENTDRNNSKYGHFLRSVHFYYDYVPVDFHTLGTMSDL